MFRLDAALQARPRLGLLDVPAHVLTARLTLLALSGDRLGALQPWALAGSVVIDIDHLPLYL